MLGHRRILDMRRGLVLREGTEHGDGGHVTRIRTIHLASLADRHLLVERVEVSSQNYSGDVRVDADRQRRRAQRERRAALGHLRDRRRTGPGPELLGRTHRAGSSSPLASHMETLPSPCAGARCEREIGPALAAETCNLAVQHG